MPEVFCNSSPIQYLFQSGHLDLLRQIYGKIVNPSAVSHELDTGRLKGVNLPTVGQLSWIEVRPVPFSEDSSLPGIGPGEAEVLALGRMNPDPTVILDDGPARAYAQSAAIKLPGTCGLLLKAKVIGILPAVRPVLNDFNRLGFRLSRATYDSILKLADE